MCASGCTFQVLETVAADLGLTHTDKLIFGTMDGVKLAGFAETFNIFEGLPRLVVLVSSSFCSDREFPPCFDRVQADDRQ